MDNFKYPRILHLFWNGKLPFLNYLTILSFQKHHPNWKINLYTTNKCNNVITWGGGAQSIKIECDDYFDKLNVNLIDITDIISELKIEHLHCVCQSDIIRMYMLWKYGGVWSDFDVIYIKNIEEVFKNENRDIFFIKKENNILIDYPIVFFLAKENSKIFNLILEKQLEKVHETKTKKRDTYTKYGSEILMKLFGRNYQKKEDEFNIKFFDKELHSPFKWTNLRELYDKISVINKKSFAIHWFNGMPRARSYINQLEKDNRKKNEIKCTMDKLIEEYL